MSDRNPKKHRGSSDHNAADYSPDELEFLKAIERYKRVKRRPFPKWTEVLQVLRDLGYHKTPCHTKPN